MPSDLPGLPGVADLAYRTRGGQALIYDGVHARGPCVVKILSADAASSDDELVERFAREVEVLGMMTEPAVVQLWGRGVYLGRPYAVLEAIEGRTFAEVIAAGPVAVDQALAWIDELLQVVAALHDREIHHRDIKPANLMLEDATQSRPARVRVLDFGVEVFESVPHRDDRRKVGLQLSVYEVEWLELRAAEVGCNATQLSRLAVRRFIEELGGPKVAPDPDPDADGDYGDDGVMGMSARSGASGGYRRGFAAKAPGTSRFTRFRPPVGK